MNKDQNLKKLENPYTLKFKLFDHSTNLIFLIISIIIKMKYK